MENKKQIQSAKPQGRCVFCNGTGLSKQHMWPAWLGRDPELPGYTKAADAKSYRNVGDRGIDVDTPQGPSRITLIPEESSVKNVHPGTHKFFNACQTCNNEWMSRIEDDSVSIAKHLILNKATLISQDQQIKLAKWTTLMAIMAEFIYAGNQAITSSERAEFYKHKQPASHFNIFIGRYEGTFYKQQHLHTSYEVGSTPGSILTRPDYALHSNFQVSTFIIGSLLLYVASTSFKPFQSAVNSFTYGSKLTKLWPSSQNIVDWQSLKGINDSDVFFLYKIAGRAILLPYTK